MKQFAGIMGIAVNLAHIFLRLKGKYISSLYAHFQIYVYILKLD